jgi:hypothetical protein
MLQEQLLQKGLLNLAKKVKTRRNKDTWKIRIQRQISNWRRELSIFTESGSGSDNIKLNIKRGKFFRNIK